MLVGLFVLFPLGVGFRHSGLGCLSLGPDGALNYGIDGGFYNKLDLD